MKKGYKKPVRSTIIPCAYRKVHPDWFEEESATPWNPSLVSAVGVYKQALPVFPITKIAKAFALAIFVVGATGFEPATSWPPVKHSIQAELRPEAYSAVSNGAASVGSCSRDVKMEVAENRRIPVAPSSGEARKASLWSEATLPDVRRARRFLSPIPRPGSWPRADRPRCCPP